ncbi:hypothetical protein WJX73_002828 [Symbiochloris irregularis]|uniref:Response regulatory domain-containing protein n=1 Tax=Symbiochloris irregularis TaxID=706552 RepID=A0AAW1PBZ0_9CHLO
MTVRKPPSLRPGFPKGLEVLLVHSASGGQADVCSKLQELSYTVTVCATCPEAVSILKQRRNFDLVIAEAKGLGALGSAQPELLTAAAGLPVVLTAETAGSADDVWKGIQLGAVEVLEKPLSSLKLQNIWQHVVRRMMHGRDAKALSSLKLRSGDSKTAAAPNSPRTPLSVGSALGSATFNSDSTANCDKVGRTCENEASVGVPETAESAPLPPRATRAATRKAQAAQHPPAASLPATVGAVGISGAPATAAMTPWGVAPPPVMQWTPGLFPHQTAHPVPGCAWGTPLALAQQGAMMSGVVGGASSPGVRPAGGSFPPGGAPPTSAAVSNVGVGRPVMAAAARHASSNAQTACNNTSTSGAAPTLHVPLIFPDGGKLEAGRAPPIGLNLRKSASLLDLLNANFAECHTQCAA